VTRFEFAPGSAPMMLEDEDVARLDAANATLRAVLREVRDTMAGEPAEAVYAALRAGVAAREAEGFVVDERSLRADAEAISEGSLLG
jgi:uncharacterized protein (DUF2267 family)